MEPTVGLAASHLPGYSNNGADHCGRGENGESDIPATMVHYANKVVRITVSFSVLRNSFLSKIRTQCYRGSLTF
jgi:hypothetical protein